MCIRDSPNTAEDPDGNGRHILMMFNPAPEDKTFMLPVLTRSFEWSVLIDTAARSPNDIYPDYDGPKLNLNSKLRLVSRSLRCYAAKPKGKSRMLWPRI